jgi:hypothetical protein
MCPFSMSDGALSFHDVSSYTLLLSWHMPQLLFKCHALLFISALWLCRIHLA